MILNFDPSLSSFRASFLDVWLDPASPRTVPAMFPVLKWEAANVRHFPGLLTDLLDVVDVEVEIDVKVVVGVRG